MTQHLFCFGYGYCAEYLQRDLMREGGWRVSGTTRDSERKAELRAQGVQASVFDPLMPLPDPLYTLRDVTHLLISTPPDDQGDPVFMTHAEDIARLKNLQWVGYLSTTGAYGDRNGGVVDENTKPHPTTQRGSRRYKAEEQWLSLLHAAQVPVHIFRLAGIYGPTRSALDSVRSGIARRIHKPGHAFNRIHIDDITQVLRASIASPQAGHIYNVCDDHPAPSHEVIDYACKLLGYTSPPLIEFDRVDMAPITRSFYKDNKRVSNEKIKTDLGVILRYPTFKEGLRACYDAEDCPSESFV